MGFEVVSWQLHLPTSATHPQQTRRFGFQYASQNRQTPEPLSRTQEALHIEVECKTNYIGIPPGGDTYSSFLFLQLHLPTPRH